MKEWIRGLSDEKLLRDRELGGQCEEHWRLRVEGDEAETKKRDVSSCAFCGEYRQRFGVIYFRCNDCPIALDDGNPDGGCCKEYRIWGGNRLARNAVPMYAYLVQLNRDFDHEIERRCLLEPSKYIPTTLVEVERKGDKKQKQKVKVRLGGPWRQDGKCWERWCGNYVNFLSSQYYVWGGGIRWDARGSCELLEGDEIRPPRGWSGKLTDIGSEEDVEWAETCGSEFRIPCEVGDTGYYELWLDGKLIANNTHGWAIHEGRLWYILSNRHVDNLGIDTPRTGLLQEIPRGKPLPEGCVWKKGCEPKRPKVKVRLGGPWEHSGRDWERYLAGTYEAFSDGVYCVRNREIYTSKGTRPWPGDEIRPPRGWNGKLSDIGSEDDVEWAETAGPDWKLPCEVHDGRYELWLDSTILGGCSGPWFLQGGKLLHTCTFGRTESKTPQTGLLQKIPRGKPLPEGCCWARGHEPKDEPDLAQELRGLRETFLDRCQGMRRHLDDFKDSWSRKCAELDARITAEK